MRGLVNILRSGLRYDRVLGSVKVNNILSSERFPVCKMLQPL